jgi:hypothetical protein
VETGPPNAKSAKKRRFMTTKLEGSEDPDDRRDPSQGALHGDQPAVEKRVPSYQRGCSALDAEQTLMRHVELYHTT